MDIVSRNFAIKDLAEGQVYYDKEIDRNLRPEDNPTFSDREIQRLLNQVPDIATITINSIYQEDGETLLGTTYGEVKADVFLQRINNGNVILIADPSTFSEKIKEYQDALKLVQSSKDTIDKNDTELIAQYEQNGVANVEEVIKFLADGNYIENKPEAEKTANSDPNTPQTEESADMVTIINSDSWVFSAGDNMTLTEAKLRFDSLDKATIHNNNLNAWEGDLEKEQYHIEYKLSFYSDESQREYTSTFLAGLEKGSLMEQLKSDVNNAWKSENSKTLDILVNKYFPELKQQNDPESNVFQFGRLSDNVIKNIEKAGLYIERRGPKSGGKYLARYFKNDEPKIKGFVEAVKKQHTQNEEHFL